MPTFDFRERSIEDYDKAIELDPNVASAYYTGVFPTVTWTSTSGP